MDVYGTGEKMALRHLSVWFLDRVGHLGSQQSLAQKWVSETGSVVKILEGLFAKQFFWQMLSQKTVS